MTPELPPGPSEMLGQVTAVLVLVLVVVLLTGTVWAMRHRVRGDSRQAFGTAGWVAAGGLLSVALLALTGGPRDAEWLFWVLVAADIWAWIVLWICSAPALRPGRTSRPTAR